ncbi:MAG: hypothetical protein KOO69_05335, partial [Victivallales bacterium]|nr:hypothetical protein [Victivallales bacterium]
LFISTATEFGFIVKGGKAEKTPVSVLQPISLLPIPDCRMFKGADNCIYFSGFNITTSQYELYLLKPENIKIDALKIKTLKGYAKIFSSNKAINAVAGDGNISYIAIENTIVYIPSGNNSSETIFVHPNETITQVQYNKQSGLFYSTNNKIGYVGKNGHLEFFKGKRHQISLAGNSLYVLSENDFGILAFDHINDLSKMNFHFAETASYSGLGLTLTELITIWLMRFLLAGVLILLTALAAKIFTKQKNSTIISLSLIIIPALFIIFDILNLASYCREMDLDTIFQKLILLLILNIIMLIMIAIGVIRLIRRKTTTHTDIGNKAAIPYKEKDETMSKKVYVKAPKAILIVQIIIIPLFMLLGILPFFVVDEEIMVFLAIFVVIWEAICIAILLNAIKILKRIKNGKIEVVEISGLAGGEENNFAAKLRDLETLKTDGLISNDEYQEKRKEMLKTKW